ncbi:MAG: RraA family protein [Planctomycetota bacterium]|nr:RraA family protein [Planctomycetota bacterium]
MTITQATLDTLATFDSPTICNVIELFDIRPRNTGYMDHRVQCNFPEFKPMVGFATTACFRSDAPPVGGDAYGSLQAQLAQFEELPGPAVVVFQDIDDPAVAAVFGEVMCSTYQAYGSVGLVTNGGGRDLEQVRALGYSVFTGSTIVAHAYCHMLHLGLPVRVAGLMVQQGDLLHGDANGVTNIPLDIIDELVDVTPEFLAAEDIIMEYVKSDEDKTIDEFTRRRVEFQDVVAKLRDRVSRASS